MASDSLETEINFFACPINLILDKTKVMGLYSDTVNEVFDSPIPTCGVSDANAGCSSSVSDTFQGHTALAAKMRGPQGIVWARGSGYKNGGWKAKDG